MPIKKIDQMLKAVDTTTMQFCEGLRGYDGLDASIFVAFIIAGLIVLSEIVTGMYHNWKFKHRIK